MDYFQGVVAEYLRANRATFINPEFLLQLNGAEKEPSKGSSWYVDVLAINPARQTVFLCEVTYSQSLSALLKRLADWSRHWPQIITALHRDSGVPLNWAVRPWIFIPEAAIDRFLKKMPPLPVKPIITSLEMTLPWRYCNYDRRDEVRKPEIIPTDMRE